MQSHTLWVEKIQTIPHCWWSIHITWADLTCMLIQHTEKPELLKPHSLSITFSVEHIHPCKVIYCELRRIRPYLTSLLVQYWCNFMSYILTYSGLTKGNISQLCIPSKEGLPFCAMVSYHGVLTVSEQKQLGQRSMQPLTVWRHLQPLKVW